MAQSSPKDAAQSFFDAIAERRWHDATALVDPEQLGPYREETLAMLVTWAQQRAAVQEMRRKKEKDGDAMVGWSTDGRLDPQLLSRYGDMPLPIAPGVRTLRDLAALPPAEFMARVFEASDLRSDERLGGVSATFTRRILGAVADGDSTAHVLYRSEGPGVRYEDPLHAELLPTVRRGDRWYVHRSRWEQDFGSLSLVMLRLDFLEGERE